MVSPLLESLAKTVNSALGSIFLDAVLERDVQGVGSDPADPPPPTTVTYTCKAIEDQWSVGLMAGGLVAGGDVQVLILSKSLSVDPLPLDRITIRGLTVTIVPKDAGGRAAVTSDPAKATWSCRCTV